ncbi:TetR/AcrR family transcriptional regulator [Brachybacterium rhamnosum]|uniref:TetR/AcrR family transcriptional regulator n=1 Tax=Brachybacterium rhamnosum TaxID=173361 RepID=A0ABW4Q073_9MICO|nr:TetR family transcriptional regulator [Brachybacterium sp. SGAir0954]QCR53396.1 TetR family transcriptional regulator [Brachybacterium sp. SGAir0954]
MNATTQAPLDGRSARWAQHREQRRAELLDVARHLIHDRGPDVTMEDIAAASGTSKSIVYRYFSDKAQLQQELGRSILATMHRRLLQELQDLEADGATPGAPERIHAMIRAYVETAERSPGVYRFIIRPSDGLNHFLDSVSRLIATFLPDSVPAPQMWAHGAVGFVEGAVDAWMTQQETHASDPTTPPPLDADDVVTHLTSWLMKGLHP